MRSAAGSMATAGLRCARSRSGRRTPPARRTGLNRSGIRAWMRCRYSLIPCSSATRLTPARFARFTSFSSRLTNLSLSRLLARCSASASSSPNTAHSRALLTATESSTRTLGSPASPLSTVTARSPDNPYTLRKTHSVSRNTVFDTQISSDSNNAIAREACSGSSRVRSRITMLVSTATTPLLDLLSDGALHLAQSLRTATIVRRTSHFIQPRGGRRRQRAQHQCPRCLFHHEPGSGVPPVRIPNHLGQNELAFGRQRCCFHGTNLLGKILVRSV